MKPCIKCLLPIDEASKLVTTKPDLCDVCAAGEFGEQSGVDADLARGLAAVVTGDRRGQAFIASYVQRKGAEQGGAAPTPPMSDGTAAGVAMLGALADLLREKVRTRAAREGLLRDALKETKTKRRNRRR